MKLKTERCGKTMMQADYSIDLLTDRESAMRWGADASVKLPFDRKRTRITDGRSYHDGTVGRDYNTIEDADAFVRMYYDTPINLIAVLGRYKDAFFSVQVLLNKQIISVGYEEKFGVLLTELEQILGLSAPSDT